MEQNQQADRYKLNYFKSKDKFFLYEWIDGEEFEDVFTKYGFKENKTFEPYTYVPSGTFTEIYWYVNEKGESIILVWDKDTEIFHFFCEDPNQTLECLNHCLDFCNKTLDFEIKKRKIYDMNYS